MEWSDVAPHLTGLAHLATITEGGRPHVSIVSPRVEDEVVWFGALRSSQKVRNLEVQPFGALVWSASGEAYVDVEVEIVDSVDEKRRLWEGWAYDPGGFFDSPESADYVLLRCRPITATVLTVGHDGPARHRWRTDDR